MKPVNLKIGNLELRLDVDRHSLEIVEWETAFGDDDKPIPFTIAFWTLKAPESIDLHFNGRCPFEVDSLIDFMTLAKFGQDYLEINADRPF